MRHNFPTNARLTHHIYFYVYEDSYYVYLPFVFTTQLNFWSQAPHSWWYKK